MTTGISETSSPPAGVLDEKENFLGISDPACCAYASSEFVIQSIPYEQTSSYRKGSARGPGAILEASRYVELFDEVLCREPYREAGICTLAPLQLRERDAKAMDRIEHHTGKLLADGKRVVSLGAEHTVTLGLVRAHAAHYSNLTVLQLDAHSDLRDTYEGSKYSHACVMARIYELGLNICQVGIRAQCREEMELIKSSKNIHTFYAHQVRSNPEWISEVISSLTDHVYLTIDADAFDPSVIPAVGTPEPGGLYWEETISFLSRVIAAKQVVGFDVVELAPDGRDIRSPYALAKLVYRLIGYLSAKR